MSELFSEIERFKNWSKKESTESEDDRPMFWELNFKRWPTVWIEMEYFLSKNHFSAWSEEHVADILYILARDQESGSIMNLIAENKETLEFVAEKALHAKSVNTKWQVAEKLHLLKDKSKADELLEKYLDLEIEYVSRMALQSLGKLRSALTEKRCEKAWYWDESDPMQEYQRINALTVLFEYGSTLTKEYIELAKQDGRTYLAALAIKLEEKLSSES